MWWCRDEDDDFFGRGDEADKPEYGCCADGDVDRCLVAEDRAEPGPEPAAPDGRERFVEEDEKWEGEAEEAEALVGDALVGDAVVANCFVGERLAGEAGSDRAGEDRKSSSSS